MTKDERRKIYHLLSQFYPNAKQLKDNVFLTAFALALERFSYDDVKKSVVDYAIGNKFFPDVSDILGHLTPLVAEAQGTAPTDSYIECAEKIWAKQTWEMCHVLRDHGHEGGFAGVLLRRHVPEGCKACPRRRRPQGCANYDKITAEQRSCPILNLHKGEGRQADVLDKYASAVCPTCAAPCFLYTKE